MDQIDLNKLQQILSHTKILREIAFFEEIDSTNSYLKRIINNVDEGIVVIADYQSQGRGRRGRTWVSPRGSSISCSILLSPPLTPNRSYILTAACALSIRDSITPLVDKPVSIKWPNDVLIGDLKVCGILAESQINSNQTTITTILGFGINVYEYPKSVNATCIADHATTQISRTDLLASILVSLDSRLQVIYSGNWLQVYEEWKDSISTIGQEVTVITDSSNIQGIAIGVSKEGGLIIRTPDNELVTVQAGEASIRKPNPKS
ncbi:biotin/acetyl-CoA-carboxylase ligase [Thermobaculum terrenum ATCC BAA-798]|uniref:biotin--[biotin carboxyl-carrier protein] ligase n=1 Tax=Thermobaculum terrenum (strain ATCC BAA-798 / CCMEE 7001 / YNP1) TaxID=525904 RepID=D1CDC0_THET1|nr:biotin--[acetyl-CoA-carboxylase] ligase [Thermobaculum terrenum]ACZ40926.1 biotin/acetyl-CoA-carboxylase ligase [Thermobaculum terrenum ATCC BAA-798]